MYLATTSHTIEKHKWKQNANSMKDAWQYFQAFSECFRPCLGNILLWSCEMRTKVCATIIAPNKRRNFKITTVLIADWSIRKADWWPKSILSKWSCFLYTTHWSSWQVGRTNAYECGTWQGLTPKRVIWNALCPKLKAVWFDVAPSSNQICEKN